MFWRQRAHVHWLEKGDRNKSYFHAQASERRETNNIKNRKEKMGWWWRGSKV
jgi:hypothetical protein